MAEGKKRAIRGEERMKGAVLSLSFRHSWTNERPTRLQNGAESIERRFINGKF